MPVAHPDFFFAAMSSLAMPAGFMDGSESSDVVRKEQWENLGVVLQTEFLRLANVRASSSDVVEEQSYMADVRFLASVRTMKEFAASNSILKQSLDATLAAGDEVLASVLLESMGITRDTPRSGGHLLALVFNLSVFSVFLFPFPFVLLLVSFAVVLRWSCLLWS